MQQLANIRQFESLQHSNGSFPTSTYNANNSDLRRIAEKCHLLYEAGTDVQLERLDLDRSISAFETALDKAYAAVGGESIHWK